MKLTTKRIIIWDKYGLRLNFTKAQGICKKIDRAIFAYYPRKFGIPCFLPIPKIVNQLVINGKPVFTGGGVNCFNDPMPIRPVLVDGEKFEMCQRAVNSGFFNVRKYNYDGFGGILKKGYTNLKPKIDELILTNDPGVYKYKDTIIPEFAIEGVQILFNPKTDSRVPDLFGQSNSQN